MLVLSTILELRHWRHHPAQASSPVVLVPTMGALHEGHLTLMREARQIAGPHGKVVVSIFVNPTQFGPKEDFSKYPRELEADTALCNSVGVDMIFAPEASEVYHSDRSLKVLETNLSARLCGASRPGHFDGVCLVVLKLFNLFQPTHAVFGKKDYQQLAIIRRMVLDLNVLIIIHGVETVREPDGLALSSRNRYLNAHERQQAAEIRRGLLQVKQQFNAGQTDPAHLVEGFKSHLSSTALLHRIDYVECVDKHQLSSIQTADQNSLIAVAVFFGTTRLIDNLELGA